MPIFVRRRQWWLIIWGELVGGGGAQGAGAVQYSETSEFIHVEQGDCSVGVNLSTKNKTKQSYMFCLEDGTKNINFSK